MDWRKGRRMGARPILVGWSGSTGFSPGRRTAETEGAALDNLYPRSSAGRWLAGPFPGCELRLSIRSLAPLCAPQGNDAVPGGNRRSPCPCGYRAMFAETPGFIRTATVDVVGDVPQYRSCSEHLLALRAHARSVAPRICSHRSSAEL